MDIIISRLREILNLEHLANWVADMIPQIVLAIFTFLAFYLLYRVVNIIILRMIDKIGLDLTASGFMLIAIKYIIMIFGTVKALQQVNINVSSIIAGLGLAGLTLGFAARDTLANIIAGIFLFWDKPFVIGDLIESGGEYGEVKEITLRTTRIVTVDSKMVSIPNSVLINNLIKSYTMEPNLRIDIDVSIGVNEEIGRTRDLLVEIVKGDERFMTSPAPVVVVTKLGDYSVDLQLRVWLENEREHIPVRFALREQVKETLDRAGVSMPFETMEIIHQAKT